MIALFPKELERDPTAVRALRPDEVIHDVPVQDPSLVATYLQRLARVHPDHIGYLRELLSPASQQPMTGDSGTRHARRWLPAVRPSHPIAP
jgi:hypothetical protein